MKFLVYALFLISSLSTGETLPSSEIKICRELLGKGDSARVYLETHFQNGKMLHSRVVKDYLYRRDLVRDGELLTLLKTHTSGFLFSEDRFKIPKFEYDLENIEMILEEIQGRDLHDLLINGKLLETQIEKLKTKFLNAVEILKQDLQAERFSIKISHPRPWELSSFFHDQKNDGLPVFIFKVTKDSEEKEFIIKSDNIIVGNTLTLIDPY